MRIRPNLRQMLRGATEEEYAALYEAAQERRSLDAEDRRWYVAPEEADASLGGAVLWASFVFWQDHPTFTLLGTIGLVGSLVLRVVEHFR